MGDLRICKAVLENAIACVAGVPKYSLTAEYGLFVVRDSEGRDVTEEFNICEYGDKSVILSHHQLNVSMEFEVEKVIYAPKISDYKIRMNA